MGIKCLFLRERTSLQLQVYYVVQQLVIRNFQYKKPLEVLIESHPDRVYAQMSEF